MDTRHHCFQPIYVLVVRLLKRADNLLANKKRVYTDVDINIMHTQHHHSSASGIKGLGIIALRGFPTRPNGTLFSLIELLYQHTVENDLSSVIWSIHHAHMLHSLTLYRIGRTLPYSPLPLSATTRRHRCHG